MWLYINDPQRWDHDICPHIDVCEDKKENKPVSHKFDNKTYKMECLKFCSNSITMHYKYT